MQADSDRQGCPAASRRAEVIRLEMRAQVRLLHLQHARQAGWRVTCAFVAVRPASSPERVSACHSQLSGDWKPLPACRRLAVDRSAVQSPTMLLVAALRLRGLRHQPGSTLRALVGLAGSYTEC